MFRALNRGRPDSAEPLSRSALSDLVGTTAQAAGLPGFSTRSLRPGFVTDAIDAGARPEQIAHHGRWANTRSLAIYDRRRELRASATPALHIAATLTTPPRRP